MAKSPKTNALRFAEQTRVVVPGSEKAAVAVTAEKAATDCTEDFAR